MVNKIMPWLEDYYFTRKKYPDVSDFVQRFDFTKVDDDPVQAVRELHRSKFFRNVLRSRGIHPSLQSIGFDELSAEQVAAIAIVCNIGDSRSLPAKLASINVTVEQYNGWLVNQSFRQRIEDRANDSLQMYFPQAAAQLRDNISDGNQRALEYYMKITGRETTPEQLNLQRAMQVLVECVQKHVPQETLAAISNEFDSRLKLTTGPVAP